MKNPNAALAVLFAVGIFFMTGGATGFLPWLAARGRGQVERARRVDWKTGIAAWAQTALRRDPQRDQLLLYQAAHPRYKDLRDFYTWKVVGAALGFIAGSILAVRSGSWLLPLIFGVLALFAPDQDVKRRARERQEHLVTEMSLRLNDLAVIVQGGRALPVALSTLAAQAGGPFIGELRRIVNEYSSGVPIAQALEHFAQRWPECPQVQTVVEALNAAESGVAVGQTLQTLGQEFLSQLRSDTLEKGLAALVKMQLPVTLLIVVASILAILAPYKDLLFMLGG